ncbi:MAG: hypothetical protein K0V04_30185 [Deltaproteobacteria bacterium]|nr:hypothetical protein [Deltaproteobacteria bacterium]
MGLGDAQDSKVPRIGARDASVLVFSLFRANESNALFDRDDRADLEEPGVDERAVASRWHEVVALRDGREGAHSTEDTRL